jgi:hypothetical protein
MLVSIFTFAALIAAAVPQGAGAATGSSTPRWMRHIERYPGGISDGVRGMVSAEAVAARRQFAGSRLAASPRVASDLNNVQMNDDSNPPLPQNETSVAYDISNPLQAVSAANDYVSGGVVVMRTSDGGKTWKSLRVVPQFRGTGDYCTGGDPSVAYSLRDDAFYMSQLCFFRALPYSEVQVYKSINGGRTWTPGRQSALVASNFNYSNGTTDTSIFNDKEYITVDNTPTSPHYGRLYVTWTKFHVLDSGFSDYCPIQLAYTDTVPTENPRLTTFTHTSVVPDNPGDNGKGETANQFSVPVVEKSGALDIAYVLEDCNTSLDRGLRMQKSVNGGNSFLAHGVRVNHKGEWADNPSTADLLPPKKFRAPNTISMAYSPVTGTLAYIDTNYIDMANTGGNVDVSLSHDGGLHWSSQQVISVNGTGNPAQRDQFFPWIAATPSGHFVAIWFDCRNDPNNHNLETFQGDSNDDGATFANTDISTTPWNPDNGFFTSGSFIGDYNGLAANDTAVYPVWTDGRHSSIQQTGIGETDIFTNVELAT